MKGCRRAWFALTTLQIGAAPLRLKHKASQNIPALVRFAGAGSGTTFASSSSSSEGQGLFGQGVSTGPGGARTTVQAVNQGVPCTANAQSRVMVPSS